jgi:hypothetical protein
MGFSMEGATCRYAPGCVYGASISVGVGFATEALGVRHNGPGLCPHERAMA